MSSSILSRSLVADTRDESLRGQLRAITIAWVFGAAWQATVTGAAVTKFQLALGTPEWAFGMLVALAYAANVFQIPASLLQSRYGRRKDIFMISVMCGRLMWAVTAMIPWVIPVESGYAWKLMAVCVLLAAAGNTAGSPAWIDWMADVVPKRIRGRFFSVRMGIGQLVTAGTALAIGYVLDVVDRAQLGPDSRVMLTATSAVVAAAGLLGALDILCFVKVKDPHPAPPPRGEPLLHALRQPLADRNFRRYLLVNFMMTVAIGFISQYIWLYILTEIDFSNGRANLMLIAIPALIFAVSYRLWGPLIDRLGKKPVLIIAGSMVVHGGWGWILVGHGAVPVTLWGHTFSLMSAIGYAIAMAAVFCWPGYEIANFNILLGMTGASEGRRNGTAYVAVFYFVVAVGGIVSGAIGGAAAKWLGPEWHWPIPGIGISLSYHGVLLLISTVIRAAAVVVALGLVEPRAVPTRDALRFATSHFYSNAIGAVNWPTRLLRDAYRITFRFSPKRGG